MWSGASRPPTASTPRASSGRPWQVTSASAVKLEPPTCTPFGSAVQSVFLWPGREADQRDRVAVRLVDVDAHGPRPVADREVADVGPAQLQLSPRVVAQARAAQLQAQPAVTVVGAVAEAPGRALDPLRLRREQDRRRLRAGPVVDRHRDPGLLGVERDDAGDGGRGGGGEAEAISSRAANATTAVATAPSLTRDLPELPDATDSPMARIITERRSARTSADSGQ